MTYIKVKDADNLVRDRNSNAILNIDSSGLSAYKTRKKQMNKVNNVNNKIELLENRLDDLNEKIDKILIFFQGKQ